MPTSRIVFLLVPGGLLAASSLLLRVLSGGKHAIKTGDLVFLIIPLPLVALATGKLKGLDVFGVKADLSALWAAALYMPNSLPSGLFTTMTRSEELPDSASK